MTAGLDTSVIVRLLVNEPPEAARIAREFVATASEEAPILIADFAIAESYFALQAHYGIAEADARSALLQLVHDRRIAASPEATRALEQAGRAPGLVDRLLHAQYQRAGAETVTFDRALGRLPGTRRLA